MAQEPDPRTVLLARFDRVLASPPRGVLLAQPGPRPASPHAYHPAPRLSVCIAGTKHVVACDGQQPVDLRMRTGMAMFMPPFAWTMPQFDSAREIVGIVFNRDYTRFLWSRHDGRTLPVRGPDQWHHVPGTLAGAGAHLLQALCARARGRGMEGDETDVLLFIALLRLAREELTRPVVERGGRARSTWQALCEHVRDNHHQPITRDTVASAFKLHPNYVSTLFSEQGGESFATFLARIRLERAAELLREGQLGVAEVGAACGYPDPGYFIKAFRKLHRTTPGRFAFNARQIPGPGGGR
jgi:AraC-like DNA-binding protein